MKRLKSAVIGLGFIGAAHIEAVRRLGFVDVVAVCDPVDAHQKAAVNHIDQSFSDYKDMIEKLDLDFIHICTPNYTHYEIAAYAIEKGINIILEKPMTMTVDEGKKLAALAKKHKVVAAVNFQNRFYPAAHYLKELIGSGEIGDITSISGSYLQDWLLYETDYSWRLETSKSGSTRAIADIGSHWIDLIEYISGLRITEVMADFKTVYHKRKKAKGQNLTFSQKSKAASVEYEEIPIDTEDMASLMLRFENGAVGSALINQMFAGKKNSIDVKISGTVASVEWNLDDLSNVVIGRRSSPNQIVTKDAGLMGKDTASLISFPAGHAEGFPDAFKQGFKQIYSKALDDKSETFFADLEAGLREMIICEKIRESSQKNSFVKIL